MMILLFILMAYSITGQYIHEILGITMFGCFLLHHIFNLGWYKTIGKGRKSFIKSVYIVMNSLLLGLVILLILSGLTMSRLIPFLNFMSISLARRIHMLTSYWSFILMAAHLGLHIQTILISIKKRVKSTGIQNIICLFILYAITIYGTFVFVKNEIYVYLFMLREFMYFGGSIGILQWIIEYLSLFIMFVVLTYHVLNFIKSNVIKNV